MKAKDRCARFQGEEDWTLLSDVFRPAGPVNCESAIPALTDFASHLCQSTKAAARTRPPGREISESLDAFRDNVSVPIQAGHDGDSAAPPIVRGREDAAVPKREYGAMSGAIDFFQVGVTFGLPTYRASDDTDDDVSDPTD